MGPDVGTYWSANAAPSPGPGYGASTMPGSAVETLVPSAASHCDGVQGDDALPLVTTAFPNRVTSFNVRSGSVVLSIDGPVHACAAVALSSIWSPDCVKPETIVLYIFAAVPR